MGTCSIFIIGIQDTGLHLNSYLKFLSRYTLSAGYEVKLNLSNCNHVKKKEDFAGRKF